MNHKLHNHPIFADTDELEVFVSMTIDSQIQSKCDCCNVPHSNKKSFQGMYSICEDCWSNNKNRAISDIQAMCAGGDDEPTPLKLINDFFKGYWEY